MNPKPTPSVGVGSGVLETDHFNEAGKADATVAELKAALKLKGVKSSYSGKHELVAACSPPIRSSREAYYLCIWIYYSYYLYVCKYMDILFICFIYMDILLILIAILFICMVNIIVISLSLLFVSLYFVNVIILLSCLLFIVIRLFI